MIAVLYITLDGLFEPLGQSQILPYLRRLAAMGTAVTVLSFEKPADLVDREKVVAYRRELCGVGIRWLPLTYHRRPRLLATAYDLLIGFAAATAVVLRYRVKIVHSRSYPPALIGWLLQRLFGVHFIFDMRAFWPDERAEGGWWRTDSWIYRIVKRLERRFLTDADEVVTVTEAARSVIDRWPGITVRRVSVVPTCVDLERFVPRTAARPSQEEPVFVYAGSIARWYLPDEMLRFFAQARAKFPAARFLILTRQCEDAVRAFRGAGLSDQAVTVMAVPHDEIPARLARAHAGLALYAPGPSRRGTCPTKIGEYLAMGLPVLVNRDVGDVEEIVGHNEVGIVLPAFTPDSYDRALVRLQQLWDDPSLPSRCRQVAEAYFSLQHGVNRYRAMYQRLAGATA